MGLQRVRVNDLRFLAPGSHAIYPACCKADKEPAGTAAQNASKGSSAANLTGTSLLSHRRVPATTPLHFSSTPFRRRHLPFDECSAGVLQLINPVTDDSDGPFASGWQDEIALRSPLRPPQPCRRGGIRTPSQMPHLPYSGRGASPRCGICLGHDLRASFYFLPSLKHG
jgi:hypothetical protein